METFAYHFQLNKPMDTWTLADQAAAEAHRAYIADAVAEGRLMFAGRSTDNLGPAIIVFQAESQLDADRFVASDPFVSSRLMSAAAHPFRVSFLRRNQ